MQGPVHDFLVENEVPADLVEQVFQRPSTDVYWLTESDETALGWKSPAFERFLTKNCNWTDGLDKAVFRGERPFEDLRTFTDCRARVTQPEARKALALALKGAALGTPIVVLETGTLQGAANVSGTATASGSGHASGAAPATATKLHKRAKATRKPPAESKTTPSS
jgi:hypothetical protein